MGWRRKDETEEQARARQAAYMRGWYAKQRDKAIARRKPCACGCGEIVTSQRVEAKYAKGHWTLGKEFGDTKRAQYSPTTQDIYWAAGFLEGEGSFTFSTGSNGYPTARVQANQVQKEPLEKLHAMFGGTIIQRSGGKVKIEGREVQRRMFWFWWCHQVRARGIMLTLYPLLSPRRQEQIRNVLSTWQRNGHASTWARRRENLKRRSNQNETIQ